jgi:hypothetical protein
MSDRRGVPPPCQLVSLVTPHESRGSYSARIGKRCHKIKSCSHLAAHCSVTAKAQTKYTRRQNVERYRRLLKSTTDQAREDYLNRLILEEQQKQKDAGDSNYKY